MTLENILRLAEKYHKVDSIADTYTTPEGVSDSGLLQEYAKIRGMPVETYMGGTPAEVKYEMDLARSSLMGDCASAMGSDYNTLVGKLNEDQLFNMALGVSGTLERLNSIEKALKKRDIEGAKEVYSTAFTRPEDLYFVKKLVKSEQDVLALIGIYQERSQEGLRNAFKGAEGKLDRGKIVNYLHETLGKADDKNKPLVYFTMTQGLLHYEMIKKAQEEAEQKAKEKEAKSGKEKDKKKK